MTPPEIRSFLASLEVKAGAENPISAKLRIIEIELQLLILSKLEEVREAVDHLHPQP